MKSDSELMNELAHRTNYLREMTQDESVCIKQILVQMYVDVQNLCDRHGL
jgi:lipopolysaccharide cholinephosphotransferase